MLYIYDTEDASIAPAGRYLLIDLTPEDLQQVAGGTTLQKNGSRISDPSLAVWYTPAAIRDLYSDGDDTLEDLTDEELARAAAEILSRESLWRDFHRHVEEAVALVREGRADGGGSDGGR